ncbi:MAG: uroporphyrinogen-III synthase [Methylomonas lenta]|nr:uroporphyrinogen-III synthase [Methylomonas lenta]
MTTGLNGAWVLVTRPVAQAEKLCKLITQQNGQALHFPTLEIQPLKVDGELIEKALHCDWLIFTSTNAVDFALRALSGKMTRLHALKLAAVGKATANALQEVGLKVACVPETEFSSEGLLAESAMHRVSSQRVMIVRGLGGREKLAQTLRSRGADVDYLEVYRRNLPDVDSSLLIQHVQDGQLQASTVTSAEGLQNLLTMLDKETVVLLQKIPLVVVSDRLKQLAQQLGFAYVIVSKQPTDAAILETLTTLLSGEKQWPK